MPNFTLKFRLRGGAIGSLPISMAAWDLLSHAVPRISEYGRFVVFDSGRSRLAINLDHVIHAQLLDDEDRQIPVPRRTPAAAVRVFMAGFREAQSFDVDPDTELFTNYDANEGDVQLQEFLHWLTLPHVDRRVVHFNASDGGKVFLLTADVAMVTIPIDKLMYTALDDDSPEA